MRRTLKSPRNDGTAGPKEGVSKKANRNAGHAGKHVGEEADGIRHSAAARDGKVNAHQDFDRERHQGGDSNDNDLHRAMPLPTPPPGTPIGCGTSMMKESESAPMPSRMIYPMIIRRMPATAAAQRPAKARQPALIRRRRRTLVGPLRMPAFLVYFRGPAPATPPRPGTAGTPGRTHRTDTFLIAHQDLRRRSWSMSRPAPLMMTLTTKRMSPSSMSALR